MASIIYLDSAATTPCDPRVIEEMLPYFFERFGNASSPHAVGTRAHEAVEEARQHVAALLGARREEIFWTSGATESNNLAILGLARGVSSLKGAKQRRRIVLSAIEHKAVVEPCLELQKEGFELVTLPVDGRGRVCLEAAHELISEETLLVSVQAANGEIGTIQPVAALSQMAHRAGALFHCDAAQAVGKIPLDVDTWGVDLLSLSAHKFYGPQGIGALFVRRGLRTHLAPRQHGGGQQRGLRSGTLPLPLIVGLGVACRLSQDEMNAEAIRLQYLRDELETNVRAGWPTLLINGSREDRLPHTTNFTFPGLPADALLAHLPHLALSTGSACSSGAPEPSPTLQAIGLSRTDASSTLRVGIGRFTTGKEITCAANELVRAATHLHQKIQD